MTSTAATDSTFTYKNPASFGIYSNARVGKTRRNRFEKRKFTFWAAFAIFLFFTFLAIVLVLDILNSTKTIKNIKTKRFVQSDNIDSINNIETVKTLPQIDENRMTNDVRIVPEDSGNNRRISRYPNHRYDAMEPKEKIYEKMMRDVYVENGWYPKQLKQKGGGPLNNIQDIISRGRTSGREERTRPKPRTKLSRPILLEGVYIRSKKEKDRKRDKEENYNYLKEINDLIQSDSVNNEKKISWIPGNGFKVRGSPFRKPPEAANIPHRYPNFQNHGKRKSQLSKSEKEREKESKPITIFLDFRSKTDDNNGSSAEKDYEEEEEEEDGEGEGKGEEKEFINKTKAKNEIIYIPINSATSFHESMVGSETKFPSNSKHSKKKNLNNMIIKLNLYPRKRRKVIQTRRPTRFVRRLYRGPVRTSHVNPIGERRTFGKVWKNFWKKKKKKGVHECPIFDVKHKGHAIKAKWKDKNGDWIHSEHVVVNHLKDDWKR